MDISDPFVFGVVFLTFLLAGCVKGVIGLGLPTVSLGLLTAAFGLPQAMALLLAPSFATNLWQAVTGGNGLAILKRIWPFLLMATVTVWIGATALTRVDVALLSMLLGLLLVAYAVTGLTKLRLTIRPEQEVWLGPVIGTANGVLTGMTGSFVVPGVMFLQAIGLPRDMLIQAMGMLFTVSTAALGLALQHNALLTSELAALSGMAIVPAIMGMVAGQLIRKRLSEARFRQVFFAALLALGAYIIARAAL